MYSASNGGSCTSRQLRRISPRALQLPHSLRALDRRTAGAPFRQRLDDPLRTLGQRGFDLSECDPTRRAHGQALEVDFHSDGAAARADQAVIDGLAKKHDAFGQPVADTTRGVRTAIDLVQ